MSDSIVLDFLGRIGGRRIIVFGAGPTGIDFLTKLPLPVAYFVDNDQRLWGREVRGVMVRPPEDLRREAPDSFVVVIASSAVEQITEQLTGLGLKPGVSVLVSPFLILTGQAGDQPACQLLVTALGRNGGLWSVDTGGETAEQILAADCRGMARLPDGFAVVLQHEGLLRLDDDLNEIARAKVSDDLNYHGLAYDAERGVLYANETAYDRLGVYRVDDLARIGEINLAKDPDGAHDQHHINDVAVHGGQLFVAMYSIEGVWRREIWNDGAVVRLDPESGSVEQVVLHGLSQPHSILFDHDQLYMCNSMDCQVLKGDKLLCQLQGYTRGIARHGRVLFIGQSEIRRLSRFRDRFSNLSLDSGIHVWNIDTYTSRFIKLPVQGVFDILVREK